MNCNYLLFCIYIYINIFFYIYIFLVFSKWPGSKCRKSHLLPSSKISIDIHISNTEILNEEKVELLGVNREGRVDFDFHVNTLFEKAS